VYERVCMSSVNRASREVVRLSRTRNRHRSPQVRQILTSFQGLFFTTRCYHFGAKLLLGINGDLLWLRICLVSWFYYVTKENCLILNGVQWKGREGIKSGWGHKGRLQRAGVKGRSECISAVGHYNANGL